jgi:prevent-host-death family protein
MPTVVNMHDAKSNLSELVKRAAAGEDIFIARDGKPAALLTRIPARKRSSPIGALKGKLHIADDFDAPLDEFKDYM